MEKITREILEPWIKKHDWFKFSEGVGPNGKQDNYLTPAGEFAFLLYNLEGELLQVSKPMAPPAPPKVVGQFPQGFPGFPGSPGGPPAFKG